MLKGWIEKALTKTAVVMVETSRSGKRRKTARNFETIEIPPSKRLVYGVYFAIVALISLTVLQAIYMLILRSFSTEIFNGIMLVIGTLLGAFFGANA